MASIRVGVQVQPQHADYDGMRRAWQEAEALGVDSIFCWDHFYPLYGEAGESGPSHAFRLDIDEASTVGLNDAKTKLVIEVWTPERGVRTIER